MRPSSVTLSTLMLALRAAADDSWAFGNMFTLGPTSDESSIYIKKATYSLVPPAVPSGTSQSDAWMSIWIGVTVSNYDDSIPLVQPLLNWAPTNSDQGCPASDDAWCVAASTFTSSGQVQQAYVALPNNKQVDFEISADGAKKVSQKVWSEGKLISEQSDSVGYNPSYLMSSNECYSNECGSLDGYTWSNLTITLSAADKSFGNTLSFTKASSSGLTTSDGGVTWTGDVKIDADSFPQSS